MASFREGEVWERPDFGILDSEARNLNSADACKDCLLANPRFTPIAVSQTDPIGLIWFDYFDWPVADGGRFELQHVYI
jgi:hypothetical protein